MCSLSCFSTVAVVACLLASTAAIAVPSDGAAAARLHRLGNFEQAAAQWEQSANPDDHARLRMLLGKAESLRALGRYQQAGVILNGAQGLATALQDDASQAAALTGLGNIALATGNSAEAEKYLALALALAQKLARHDLLAAIHVSLGNLHAAREQPREALAAYEQGAEHGRQAGNTLLRAQALGNAARVAAMAGDDSRRALAFAEEARNLVSGLENSHDKAFLLLSLAQFHGRQTTEDSQPRAYQTLMEALRVADAIGDARARSYALGYLAQLYERQGRDADVRDLNQRAIAALQQVDAPEIAYRWHWQLGRLKNRQQDADGAIADYRLAVHYLQSIRADLPVTGAAGQSSFREVLGPLYFELADLLLRRAAGAPAGERKQKLLGEARNAIELSKAAELQDYFQDSCVAARQGRMKEPARLGADVAVIYPILLPDRLELIADFADGMRQLTVPVSSRQVVESVRNFRARLEKRTTREYLPYSQELYGWLLRPLEAELAAHGVKTLVFVPDGALRTIPMSALHDGQAFLVARYAVATTPSLALTDIQGAPAEKSPRALLNGLTQAVQGFSELPNVEAELQAVGQLYRGKVLKDQEYVVGKVEYELEKNPYSVVHIASHGQFESDVRKTFLLAYDGKLTMDSLEKLISPSRYRDQPISLLTLSACQTAAGDDRAALGLAGVAVKAGASSALASLWFINDQSASMLVAEFYAQLRQPGMSKAHALQNAQLRMLTDKRFSHPSYWSPFLLIGNWL